MEEYESREQDKFLPISKISRVMKKALPPNARLVKKQKSIYRTKENNYWE